MGDRNQGYFSTPPVGMYRSFRRRWPGIGDKKSSRKGRPGNDPRHGDMVKRARWNCHRARQVVLTPPPHGHRALHFRRPGRLAQFRLVWHTDAYLDADPQPYPFLAQLRLSPNRKRASIDLPESYLKRAPHISVRSWPDNLGSQSKPTWHETV
ncbi:hypothetical protein B0T18DRAFT_387609 [Schizothecium vesticola]|uniref:Uncharacterized protein n=1 Tax=Schizothecium vesticola TaxID=314040 RepID=A0AA40F5C0_9PEZI|nr:hypothetical protein B0T18DRAFT_387609 [Schizothecium vesticola]